MSHSRLCFRIKKSLWFRVYYCVVSAVLVGLGFEVLYAWSLCLAYSVFAKGQSAYCMPSV